MASVDMRTAGARPRPGILGGILAALLLMALVTIGLRPVGPLPALGPLLDPVAGVWSVARQARPPASRTAVIPTLDGPVEVHVDPRAVPHIRATTTLDAIRALGYLQASERLFQLELQTRASAGTLTELIGEGALEIDREQRRLGLAWSARRALQALPESSADLAFYRALADGINARIDTLGKGELPLEYHYLGTTPQRWEPLHSLLLDRRMSYTLSYSDEDLWRLRAAALVGQEAADALYPVNSPLQEPVEPNGDNAPRALSSSLVPPASADAAALRRADAMLAAVPPPPAVPDGMVLGSNNWAIAASRSATGNAILAGDPHLELTLPSIWYEAHLVVEEEGLDVHGVTIPGVPGIVLGFTPQVAWSVTNNAVDVVDFYTETLDDPQAPTRYRLDGEWQELQSTRERFLGPDGELLDDYTQYYTHRGPLFLSEQGALSMRWLALEASARPTTFDDAARASDVSELMEALATFAVPAQNFIMADSDGRIAIRSTGHYPIRPPLEATPGQGEVDPRDGADGRRIRDGSTRASDWVGFWPLERYPQAIDPVQGYLASANQQPIDPQLEPAYLGSNWTSPWRALRINRLMREATEPMTADDLQRFQTDAGNEKALRFAPYFVAAADGSSTMPAAMLDAWDGRYLPDAPEPLLFETAFGHLKRLVWDELDFDAAPTRGLPRPPWPREAVLWALVEQQPASPWWDRQETSAVERRDDILRAALSKAWAQLRDAHGEPELGGWAWRLHRRVNINHLARFPGLGRLGLESVGAGPGNLNPSSGRGTHGASWRMVVELSERGPEARVVYPGGQSGNPASRHYDDRLAGWQRGALAPVNEAPRVGDRDHGHWIHLVPGKGERVLGAER